MLIERENLLLEKNMIEENEKIGELIYDIYDDNERVDGVLSLILLSQDAGVHNDPSDRKLETIGNSSDESSEDDEDVKPKEEATEVTTPKKEEKVIAIKKGDAIALQFGVVTWWYNKEDTKLAVFG